jgi:hypothetical protein
MTIKPGDRGRLVERRDRVRYVLKGGKIKEHFADGRGQKLSAQAGHSSVAREKHFFDGQRWQNGGALYYRPGILVSRGCARNRLS